MLDLLKNNSWYFFTQDLIDITKNHYFAKHFPSAVVYFKISNLVMARQVDSVKDKLIFSCRQIIIYLYFRLAFTTPSVRKKWTENGGKPGVYLRFKRCLTTPS
jgi:hypothetical protein